MNARQQAIARHLVVAIVVILGAAWSYSTWQLQLLSGRAQTLSRLLATSRALRVMDNPGVEAWLGSLLEDAGSQLRVDQRGEYHRLLHWTSNPEYLPVCVRPMAAWMRTPPDDRRVDAVVPVPPPPGLLPARRVEHLRMGDRTLVLTGPRARHTPDSGVSLEVERAAAQLLAIAEVWQDPEDSSAPRPPLLESGPHLIGLGAMIEDGNHLSIRFPAAHERDDPEAGARALQAETKAAWRRPDEPSLVANNFFGVFTAGQPLAEQIHYTGVYTDVSGFGLIATVWVPVSYGVDGLKVMLYADLDIDIPLESLVVNAEPPLTLALTASTNPPTTPTWQPWSALRGSLPIDSPEPLREAVDEQARRERDEERESPLRSVIRAQTDSGVLLATRVTRDRWIVGWLAETRPAFPWAPVLLMPCLLIGGFAWTERRRRRMHARGRAIQSTIDGFGLSLVAIDPDDDSVVFGNPTAFAHQLADAIEATRQDERNKLATILDHGADTPARVLAAQLRVASSADELRFCQWLADYLLGRLHVTQWVLDHWGGPERGEVECILGPEHLRGAVEQYQRMFEIAADHPQLRTQLNWHNGTLAARSPAGRPIIEAWIEWPAEYRLTAPADGLFGYFLGEVLINAIKHGTPGLAIELEVDFDRARRELALCVRNQCPTPPPETPERKTYGGLAVVVELARLCGWQLVQRVSVETFELRWACPVTLQRPAGQID